MDKATIRANVLKDLEGYIRGFDCLADIPEVDILGWSYGRW